MEGGKRRDITKLLARIDLQLSVLIISLNRKQLTLTKKTGLEISKSDL